MLGQEDRKQERGVLDALDRVWLSRGQVEELPGLKVLRLAEGGEGHPPLQALHDDLALGLMLLDFLARRDDQADDLHLLGTNQGLRLGRGQRRGPTEPGFKSRKESAMNVTTIGPRQLADLCKSGQIDLIDVRTPVEYRELHATHARNLPLDRLDPRGRHAGP